MRIQRAAYASGTLAALLVLAGCSEPKMAEVSGAVTLDGQPVKRGAISFIPLDGNTPTAGGEIRDGRYTATVPITTMKVSISARRLSARRNCTTPRTARRGT